MSERTPLKLATRGSDLALAQSGTIAAALRERGAEVELEIVNTAGDLSAAERFADIGPQGVFVREIEHAVVDGRADLAVHSCKDLPTSSPQALCIAAVPKRLDAHDVLLIRKDALRTSESLAPLANHAKVGTSSARRQAWIRHFRRDIEIVPLRGNVPTRLTRLRDGDYDAIVLAAAGLDRLKQVESLLEPLLADITAFPLDAGRFVPAPAQGALAVQCRADDKRLRALLGEIDDRVSRACVTAEREALAQAGGGCEIAFGAHCHYTGAGYELSCMLERTGQIHTVTAGAAAAEGLGRTAWQALAREFAGD